MDTGSYYNPFDWYPQNDGAGSVYYNRRHQIKRQASPDVHIMNKDEAKTLRRLKAQTGLTEDQLRVEKKYRKILSEAQKQGQKPKPKPRSNHSQIKCWVRHSSRVLRKDPWTFDVFKEVYLRAERQTWTDDHGQTWTSLVRNYYKEHYDKDYKHPL